MTSGGNNFSRTFQDLKLQFSGLDRTKVIFQDFPGPGILQKKIQDFPGGMGTYIKYAAMIFNSTVVKFQSVNFEMMFYTALS